MSSYILTNLLYAVLSWAVAMLITIIGLNLWLDKNAYRLTRTKLILSTIIVFALLGGTWTWLLYEFVKVFSSY